MQELEQHRKGQDPQARMHANEDDEGQGGVAQIRIRPDQTVLGEDHQAAEREVEGGALLRPHDEEREMIKAEAERGAGQEVLSRM